MPISKSAKKAWRNAKNKTQKNVVLKTKLKTTLHDAKAENLSKVFSTIDKAVKRNLLHKNKAARIKSKLAKSIGSGKAVAKKSVTKKKSTKKVSKKKK
ncbi:MAG: hypothetical protein ACD_58C00016G0001 [uncultured bacterium]|nr:MAG: hypothetical protein ACD_58C00016G0001 [uncultured bacterium]